MKIYIHSNYSKPNFDIPLDTIQVVVNIIVPRSAVMSSNDIDMNESFIDPQTGRLVISLYRSFLDKVKETAWQDYGLKLLHEEPSTFVSPTYGLSNSMYFDFCIDEQAKSGSVRFDFALRISDHEGNPEDHKRHAKQRAKNYSTNPIDMGGELKRISNRNSRGGVVKPEYGVINVGETKCRTPNDAMYELRNLFEQYIELEKTPYWWDDLEEYLHGIENKVNKEDSCGVWKATDSLEHERNQHEFALYFCKQIGGRLKNVFSIMFNYEVGDTYGIMAVTLRPDKGESKNIYTIKYTNHDTRQTIFDQNKLKRLFEDQILPLMKKTDNNGKLTL